MTFQDLYHLSDLVPEVLDQKSRLARLIEENNADLIRKHYALEKFIEGIPDSLTRIALRMRFIDGKSWGAIAYSIGGGQSTSTVRMMCKRYLASIEMPKELK